MPPQRKRREASEDDEKKIDTKDDENNNNNTTTTTKKKKVDVGDSKSKPAKKDKKDKEEDDRVVWEWAGDSKKGGSQDIWVKYKQDVAKKIETAFKNKEDDFKLDDERFIDFKEMLQRRYDSKNKKRAIRRREIKNNNDDDEEVDEKDLSMVFRIYDEHGRGKIDSDELNSIVRAFGQEDMDDSEIPKGLVDFSTVKDIVKKRTGKMRDSDATVDGKVIENMKILEKKKGYYVPKSPEKPKPAPKKAAKGKKKYVAPVYTPPTLNGDPFPEFFVSTDKEPGANERNKINTFYNKSAMLHTKDEIDATSIDRFANVVGNEHDLGKDHAFAGYVVLIGMFYDEHYGAHGACGICTNPIGALKEKGFNVILTRTPDAFLSQLQYADVAWVVSGAKTGVYGSSAPLSPQQDAEFRKALIEFHERGGGLCIWGDNDPYFAHANAFLTHFNTELIGNTPGSGTLKLGDGKKTGNFSRHLLTSGIANLFEGVTICYPSRSGDFQLLGTSTNANPVMLYLDHEPRGTLSKDVGRIVIDCAFTKLYINWDTAGTARWVSNISVWLLGLDTKIKSGAGLEGVLSKTSV